MYIDFVCVCTYISYLVHPKRKQMKETFFKIPFFSLFRCLVCQGRRETEEIKSLRKILKYILLFF